MSWVLSKKIFIIISAFLSVGLFVLFVFLQEPKPEAPKYTPPPAPAPTVREIDFVPISQEEQERPLIITGNTIPARMLGVHEGFLVNFSQTPAPSYFFYTIIPDTKASVSVKNKDALFIGSPEWKADTEYKLIIHKETRDVYGNLLDKNYEFIFKTASERGI